MGGKDHLRRAEGAGWREEKSSNDAIEEDSPRRAAKRQRTHLKLRSILCRQIA